MRVFVDPDFCAGHGVCVVTCPDVFGLTDDGYAEVLVDEVPDELAELVAQAERECPARAISVTASGEISSTTD